MMKCEPSPNFLVMRKFEFGSFSDADGVVTICGPKRDKDFAGSWG